jgi:hypothetical protein
MMVETSVFNFLRNEDLAIIFLSTDLFFVAFENSVFCVPESVFLTLSSNFYIVGHPTAHNLCAVLNCSIESLALVLGDVAISKGKENAIVLFHSDFIHYMPSRLAGVINNQHYFFAFAFKLSMIVNSAQFTRLCMSPSAVLHPKARNFVMTSDALVTFVVGKEAVDRAVEKQRSFDLRRRN